MDSVPTQLDAAEIRSRVVAKAIVVIAGNVDDTRSLAGLAQKLLQDVVMALRPVRAAADFPEVYDVADQVKVLTLDVF